MCILSVLAQVCIDNAKRVHAINTSEEIDRIKRDMDININGYPMFWKAIKKKNDKRNGVKLSELTDKQIQRRNAMYNPEIICPMNSLYNMNINPRINGKSSIYPIDKFLNIYELDISKSKSKKVEELITILKADGYEVISGPRTTGDGYYESCIIAFEGNQIEITV